MGFTSLQVKKMKPRDKRYELSDGAGLYIQISPNGSKRWIFKYKIAGSLKRVTIGGFPKISLAKAREKAAKLRAIKDRGEDPASEKLAMKQMPMVKDFAGEYIERWAKPNKKTWEEDQRILNRYVVPYIGGLKIGNVTRRHVIAVIDKLKDRGAETMAARTYEVVRRMFNFSIERGVLEMHPVNHIKMPAKKSRERFLSRDEIRAFFEQLNTKSLWFGTRISLELILRTGQRPGEVRQMTSEELDFSKNRWTIPAEKTKNGLAQVVPLVDQVSDLIRVSQTLSSGNWIFRAPRNENAPVSAYALAQAMRRILKDVEIEHATPHDLRRTAATYISELGFNRIVVDKILNHSDGSATAIYDRYLYEREKREALEAWNNELDFILNIKNR